MFKQAFKLGMVQKLKWRIELQQDFANGEFQLDDRLPEIPVFQTLDPVLRSLVQQALINHYEVKTLLSKDKAYDNIIKQMHLIKSDPYQPKLIQALISMQKRVRTLGNTRFSLSHERIRSQPVYNFANFKSYQRKIRPLQQNNEAHSQLHNLSLQFLAQIQAIINSQQGISPMRHKTLNYCRIRDQSD
ncbi:hypothetical protein FGO68_gene5534 [Halteria grandinella]|uniref:Uncharacterized protein n=1 Tax=Halteria grandinella TaxID=5974 RepID=A0A8J8T1Q8_HALGN|nr:hypothetical protein FGO68_gene5534 [Halteria grandinella]